jgi:hypothetical protein
MPESPYVTAIIGILGSLAVGLTTVLITKHFTSERNRKDRIIAASSSFRQAILPVIAGLEKKEILDRLTSKKLVTLMNTVEPAVTKFVCSLDGRALKRFNTAWVKYKATYEDYQNDDTFSVSVYMPPAIGIENIRVVSDSERHEQSLEHRNDLLIMLRELVDLAKKQ